MFDGQILAGGLPVVSGSPVGLVGPKEAGGSKMELTPLIVIAWQFVKGFFIDRRQASLKSQSQFGASIN